MVNWIVSRCDGLIGSLDKKVMKDLIVPAGSRMLHFGKQRDGVESDSQSQEDQDDEPGCVGIRGLGPDTNR